MKWRESFSIVGNARIGRIGFDAIKCPYCMHYEKRHWFIVHRWGRFSFHFCTSQESKLFFSVHDGGGMQCSYNWAQEYLHNSKREYIYIYMHASQSGITVGRQRKKQRLCLCYYKLMNIQAQ